MGEGKVLVCVRSVGPRRTVRTKKKEGTLDLIQVGIYDDTASCIFTLWEDKIPSAKLWVPTQTVLLISQPWSRINDSTNRLTEDHLQLGIGYSTFVDVDPDIPEAAWLRTKIQDMARKASVIIPFPSNTWDIQLAIHGPGRTLYTLAEIEDQVRHQDPAVNFTGKLSVIVHEMNLLDQWRKTRICCTEW